MKKMNNKGFSLVELIVVIAIMAILAVTLAPRLTQYVEKARKASDEEVINAIYTAVRLGVLDDDILEDAVELAEGGFELNTETTGLYTVSGKEWTISDEYTEEDSLILDEINEVVGTFKLKSSSADNGTTITLKVANADTISVALDYNGDGDADYTASDASLRPQ